MKKFKLKKTLAHLFHPQRSNNHRPQVLHNKSFIYLGLIIICFVGLVKLSDKLPAPYNQILGLSSSITPSQVLEQINQERAKLGLLPLHTNSKLNQAALAKAQDMFADNYWAHVAPDGTQPWDFMKLVGYSYQIAGENLARDFSNTANMTRAWMNSPAHKANIVNAKYHETGIAVLDGRLAGHETTLVVQMFGARQSQAGLVESGSQTELAVAEASQDIAGAASRPEVLASAVLPQTDLSLPPLFSPLQITKAFFLGLIMMLTMTLLYDFLVIGHKSGLRLVGKNLAHIIFFFGVAFLLIFFKGGIIG